jgi:hypothetical protein
MADGTRIRLRWEYEGTPPVDAAAVRAVRGEKEAAFDRLTRIVAGALPVIEEREVAS